MSNQQHEEKRNGPGPIDTKIEPVSIHSVHANQLVKGRAEEPGKVGIPGFPLYASILKIIYDQIRLGNPIAMYVLSQVDETFKRIKVSLEEKLTYLSEVESKHPNLEFSKKTYSKKPSEVNLEFLASHSNAIFIHLIMKFDSISVKAQLFRQYTLIEWKDYQEISSNGKNEIRFLYNVIANFKQSMHGITFKDVAEKSEAYQNALKDLKIEALPDSILNHQYLPKFGFQEWGMRKIYNHAKKTITTAADTETVNAEATGDKTEKPESS